MTRTTRYEGTTLTAFIEKYFSLLVLLGIFIGLTFYSANSHASHLGQAIALFSFAITFLVWIALLFQCAQARPLTALMELFSLTLLFGFIAWIIFYLAEWRTLRAFTLPALLYSILFLLSSEIIPPDKQPRTLASRLALRAACLVAAGALAYTLLFLLEKYYFT